MFPRITTTDSDQWLICQHIRERQSYLYLASPQWIHCSPIDPLHKQCVGGDRNTYRGSLNIIVGDHNFVQGDNNVIYGTRNTIIGADNLVFDVEQQPWPEKLYACPLYERLSDFYQRKTVYFTEQSKHKHRMMPILQAQEQTKYQSAKSFLVHSSSSSCVPHPSGERLVKEALDKRKANASLLPVSGTKRGRSNPDDLLPLAANVTRTDVALAPSPRRISVRFRIQDQLSENPHLTFTWKETAEWIVIQWPGLAAASSVSRPLHLVWVHELCYAYVILPNRQLCDHLLSTRLTFYAHHNPDLNVAVFIDYRDIPVLVVKKFRDDSTTDAFKIDLQRDVGTEHAARIRFLPARGAAHAPAWTEPVYPHLEEWEHVFGLPPPATPRSATAASTAAAPVFSPTAFFAPHGLQSPLPSASAPPTIMRNTTSTDSPHPTSESLRVLEENNRAISTVPPLRTLILPSTTSVAVPSMLEGGNTTCNNASSTNSAGSCVICLSDPKVYACMPCAHVCYCQGCLEEQNRTLKRKKPKECPVCRHKVSKMIRLYF